MLSDIVNYTDSYIEQYVLMHTNVGGWFFDAFLKTDHTSKLTITEHPVQTGANITDHSFLQPKELTMEIGMSDCAISIIPGQFYEGSARSVTAFNVLMDLQKQRIPIQVSTRLGQYKNMLIETITSPDDYKTATGLRASVTFKEVIVANVTTVNISARPQVTDTTNRGNIEPVTPNQSIASSITEKITGKSATTPEISSVVNA